MRHLGCQAACCYRPHRVERNWLRNPASDADLRRLLGSQGADLARRSFEADAMIDATLAVYEDLLAGMGGRHVGHPRVRLPQMGA